MYLNIRSLIGFKSKVARAIMFILLLHFINPCYAQNKTYINLQTYTIESFEGQTAKITVVYDYDDRLKISYFKDTLSIYRTYGIIGNIEIINKKFLKIICGYMAGSNLHIRREVLLCIKDNKLQVPLEITSFINSDVTQAYNRIADSLKLFNEQSTYEAKLQLTGLNNSEYKLSAIIHDENISKHDPRTNYNRNDQTVLYYDEKQNIFYNGYKNIAEYYTVFHPDTYLEDKQYIFGTFPTISLGALDYYFIKDGWYEKGRDNYLIAYSTFK